MRGASANVVGAAFMTASMAGFALEDSFLKAAAGHMPVGEVLAIYGLVGTLAFAMLAHRSGVPVLHPWMISRPMLLRAGFESGGRAFYTLALALTSLSNASAIMQAMPIAVVAGAALFLGERVGWRRWLAIWAGFGGVLMILRPGLDGFDAATILAVIGTLGFAGRDLATRASTGSLSNAQIGICGFGILVPTGLGMLVVTGGAVWPTPTTAGFLLAGTAFGLASYAALTHAMRTGEVSAVSPFRYTRLIFGVGVGMLVFAERPDAMTFAGAAVVIASGLYIMLRQRAGRETT